jgi:hypothetical protein
VMLRAATNIRIKVKGSVFYTYSFFYFDSLVPSCSLQSRGGHYCRSDETVCWCSLPLWRVHEIKRTYLASRIHGLFIT